MVNEYLSALENARISVTDNLALESLPAGAFSGAYSGADTLVTSAAAPVAKLSEVERDLLKRHLESRLRAFQMNQALRNSYLHTLGNQG